MYTNSACSGGSLSYRKEYECQSPDWSGALAVTMSRGAVAPDLRSGKHTAFLERADVIEGICHVVFVVPEEVSGSFQGSIKYKRTNILNGRPRRKEKERRQKREVEMS